MKKNKPNNSVIKTASCLPMREPYKYVEKNIFKR